jgi:hypothetical protein
MIAFVLVGLFTFQLYALVLPQVVQSFQVQVGGGRVEKWTKPLWAIFEVIRGLQIGFGTVFAGAIAVLIFFCGLVDYARSNRIVIALFVVPVATGAMALIALHRHFYPRFFFFELGIGILIFIRGTTVVGVFLANLIKRGMTKENVSRIVSTSLTSIIIIVSVFSLDKNYRYPKQDYIGALSYIEKQRRPDDLIVTVGLASYAYSQYYAKHLRMVETVNEMQELASEGKRVWLIYTFPDHLESFYPDIASIIRQECVVVQSFLGTVGGGTIYVCRAEPFFMCDS